MEAQPRVFLLDPERLIAVRSRVYAADERFVAADESLLEAAHAAFALGPYSVAENAVKPSGVNPQDYMSLAPYWWPDADGEDGLPYTLRDGEMNDECAGYDHPRLLGLCTAVNALSAAYFFSDFEDFAERAALLLRTFFLDEAWGMQPHLQYGQAIRGRCEGRPEGIIDTYGFTALVDRVGLLANAVAWNAADQDALEEWFGSYLNWLLTSEYGLQVQQRMDCHGISYDVQVAALSLFCGRKEEARRAVSSGSARIYQQIDEAGCQPFEVVRARSLDYCTMNLSAFFDLADLGRHVGYDLWAGAEGQRLYTCYQWLVAHGFDATWPHRQNDPFERSRWLPLLRRAGLRWSEERSRARWQAVDDVRGDWSDLLYAALDA